jgi:hypothetical protein
MCGAPYGTRIARMTLIRADLVSVEIRQIHVIRVPRRDKSAFIRVHQQF